MSLTSKKIISTLMAHNRLRFNPPISPHTSLSLAEIKLQPEPSAVLGQLAQRQQHSSSLATTEPLMLPQMVPTPPGSTAAPAGSSGGQLRHHSLIILTHSLSPSGHESSVPSLREGVSAGVKLPGLELPTTEAPQRQLKTQRRRVPPPSKVSALWGGSFYCSWTEGF